MSSKTQKYKKYEGLSPFELKNNLIKLASNDNIDNILNSGRGNPDFLNTPVRRCFAHLQLICLQMSDNIAPNLATFPLPGEKKYKKLLLSKIKKLNSNKDRVFLKKYINFISKNNKNSELALQQLVISVLGCFYPEPPQIQSFIPSILEPYMFDIMFGTKKTKEKPSNYNFFPTEGGTAGILYVFDTLHINGIINNGDKIAVITPIFSPYLELPGLKKYNMKIIELKGDPDNNWKLSDSEINKLKDKSIKGLFMVNPGNPTAYSLPLDNINKIGKIVNTIRKDLVIVSDCVYAPFTDEYNSLMYSCPKNTIEIFSLSKYFGCTGIRLGIIMLRNENRFSELLKKLPSSKKKKLNDRYKVVSLDPSKLTFMQRLVLDSRQVAEAHTGGLSTLQQIMMSMFVFFDMDDTKHKYKKNIQKILKKRMKLLYSELKFMPDENSRSTNYYTLIDLPHITELLYGKKAKEKLMKTHYLEFLFHLSKKYHTVLLPGVGFAGNKRSYRASLANLRTNDYKQISNNIKNTIRDLTK
tara:strand:+ start:2378 stop:3955 length:1578 start_codon:yes stop_codon:yes gene_type:complete